MSARLPDAGQRREIPSPSSTQAKAIREAAGWYARLADDDASEHDRQAWRAWHAEDPLHREAWMRVEHVRSQMARVPGEIAAPTLARALSRRHVLRGALAVGSVSALGWLTWRATLWQELQADYRTGTGERREVRLADGSRMSVNTRSSVDVLFDASRRLVHLHAGEILVTTAHDTEAVARPFLVRTSQGSVLALGTRFDVRTDGARTVVSVLEKAVRVWPVEAFDEGVLIRAGQQVAISSGATSEVRSADAGAGAWENGSLIALDMPLAKLIDDLARYRPGVLACDASVAEMRISGAFSIDDTDRSLDALANAFPLRIRRVTPYWVTVTPR